RTSACEAKLEPLAAKEAADNGDSKDADAQKSKEKILAEVSAELDSITKDVNELERFSRVNFTGFLKAGKKHDRRRPPYKIRPLLQVRLSALPFNSEDYSPLLYRYELDTLPWRLCFLTDKHFKDFCDVFFHSTTEGN